MPLQCTRECGIGTFPAASCELQIDETTFLAQDPLPTCPDCGALARPNILMFGDAGWDVDATHAQQARLDRWLRTIEPRGIPLAVVECGAGGAVPTIRSFSEQVARRLGATLIRINCREPEVPAGGGHFGLAGSALETLRAIDAAI